MLPTNSAIGPVLAESKKILIVENEPSVASTLENNLVSMDYHVVAKAISAEEAIFHARKYNPDVILMDIRLDGKLDGIDAAEIINFKMKIPIIYLTAWMNDEYIERAKPTLPFGYMLKPFHVSELKAMIELSIFKQQIERQNRKTREHFKSILDNLNEALISVSVDGTIKYCNKYAEKLFDVNPDDLCGKPITSLMTGDGSRIYEERMKDILFTHRLPKSSISEHMCFDDSNRQILAEVTFIPCRVDDDCFMTMVINDFKTNSSGILPICAHCKKIRIDGKWIPIEDYFTDTLQVGLTHSICPRCITSYFSDMSDSSHDD